MTTESGKAADNKDEVGRIVANLTETVEKEVKAFHALFDVLMGQQASILQGDAESVSKSNEEVERIVSETKQLENEVRGKSRILSEHFDADEDLSLSRIIPLVEDRYAARLSELRELLITLHAKIQRTNQRNSYLLENSLRFIDESSRILAGGISGDISYSKEGKTERKESSLFSGMV